MKILQRAWCWLLIAGIVAVAGIYGWMGVEIVGVPASTISGTARDIAVFAVLLAIYEFGWRRRTHPPPDPTPRD